jgi:hypothetical protein
MHSTWHSFAGCKPTLCVLWIYQGSLGSCTGVAADCLTTDHVCVCPFVLQAIAILDEVGRQAYHIAAPVLLPTLDSGLRTVDGVSKQYLGWDTRLYSTSKSIWT